VSVGPNRTLPIDGEIQIAFDRYLLPASVTRQSVFVVDANGQPIDPVITRYDPVSRTISVSGSNATWLTEGQPYKLRFTIPPDDDVDDRGLRAIDRATLNPNQPLEVAFFASAATGTAKPEKTISFCGDVLPIFSMKCTSGVCHAGGPPGDQFPAAGLVLDSYTGILKTAYGRVANSANTGGRSGDPSKPRGVFGIDMPLIDPGAPDNSWLLYKIELAREPAVDAGSQVWICNTKPGVDTVAFPTSDPFRFDVKVHQADDIERAILNDYVPGREMPYPPAVVTSPIQQALTFDERQRIRLWIAQGAKLEECGGCTPVAFLPPPDGGADAGSDADSDAGATATDGGDASTDAADQ
jgi:hypothetical protein